MDDVVIPQRFCGPPRSGNGGYTAGLLAGALLDADGLGRTGDHAVEVSLRMPPPLEAPLAVRRTDAGAELLDGDALVAAARVATDELSPVDPVDLDEAVAASAGFPGHTYHPFPTCFGCGTARPDGLRLFPGPVAAADDGAVRVATAWTPAADVAGPSYDEVERASYEVTWAALDCVGGWASDLGDRLMVLGRMTTCLDTLPAVGEPHVVLGQAVRAEGRKAWSRCTLYDGDGRIVGRAEQLWIGVDPSTFGIAAKS